MGTGISGLENVEFDGRLSPLRHGIHAKGFGDVSIAGEQLENALINDEGEYVSESARELDESIFFFAKDSWLSTLDDAVLAKRVSAQIA